MATGIVPPNNKTLDQIPEWQRLRMLYPNYEFDVFYVQEHMSTQVRVKYTRGTTVWRQDYVVSDHAMVSLDHAQIVKEVTKKLVEPFTASIGESITGKYPFIRLWADRHLVGVPDLFGYPNRDIPGFVFPKFKNLGEGSEYPKHGTVTLQPTTTSHTELPEVDAEGDTNRAKALADITFTDTEKMVREINMAQKGKVKIKKRPINPDKVKKPNCAKHDKPMEFDPVSQKWRCKVDGCNMVARPKDDENDRSVTIGKGGVQMRLIFHEGKSTVLLISDNNIALDITRWVDVKTLISNNQLEEKIKAADEEDQTSFVLNEDINTFIKGVTLHVMGVDDYVLNN